MRVRVLVRSFFLLLIKVCVCACERVCVCRCVFILTLFLPLFLLYFFIMVYILFHNDTINFPCRLSRWQCQYRSCSRSPMQYQSSIAHDIPLPWSPLISMYTRSTAKKCTTHSAQSPGVMPVIPSSISFFIPRNETIIKTHWGNN